MKTNCKHVGVSADISRTSYCPGTESRNGCILIPLLPTKSNDPSFRRQISLTRDQLAFKLLTNRPFTRARPKFLTSRSFLVCKTSRMFLLPAKYRQYITHFLQNVFNMQLLEYELSFPQRVLSSMKNISSMFFLTETHVKRPATEIAFSQCILKMPITYAMSRQDSSDIGC